MFFTIVRQAFNLAETYQLPVIVLPDKYLAESHATVQGFDLKAVKIERGTYLMIEGIIMK